MQSRPAGAGLTRAYHLVTGQGRVVFFGIRIAEKISTLCLDPATGKKCNLCLTNQQCLISPAEITLDKRLNRAIIISRDHVMESWLSGLRRTTGNRVRADTPPWVQIPNSPLEKSCKRDFFFWFCQAVRHGIVIGRQEKR